MDARFVLEFACQEEWEGMRELAPGERRCERCSETVVDLSRMSKKKALEVVGQKEPPCVSYLVMGDEPLFRRETLGAVRGGLMAAAAGLLAACSTPEPACDLAPESAVLADEPLLEPTVSAGPLSPSVGAPTTPIPALSPTQHGGPLDTAIGGDPNDVDGDTSRPTTPAFHGHTPPTNNSIHRLRGRVTLDVEPETRALPRPSPPPSGTLSPSAPGVPPVPSNMMGSS